MAGQSGMTIVSISVFVLEVLLRQTLVNFYNNLIKVDKTSNFCGDGLLTNNNYKDEIR